MFYHVETSQLTCFVNQLTGFYMIEHWSLIGQMKKKHSSEKGVQPPFLNHPHLLSITLPF